MGRVQSSLVLNDQMSKVLGRINKAMGSVLDSFEAVQRASGRSFNTANIAAARREIGAADAALNEMEQSYRDCNDQQQHLNKHIGQGTTAADGLLGKIKSIASAYLGMKAVKGLVGLSDTTTQTTARLSMMNDGLQTTTELNNMIYASAQRSRGSYLATADAVAKLGLMAGDAFSSNKETIAFMEQVNKQFKIAGTNAQGVDAAMLQLTQAMGSGVLRGEEYNSILEQAPNIIQAIAKYMNVPKGKLKDMAADGKITANIVKAAMFACADETNAKFESMPKTWSDIWTSMQNRAIKALDPVLAKINEMANSDDVQAFTDNLIKGFTMLSIAALNVFNIIAKTASFFRTNWSVMGPIIRGIVAAFAAYNAVLLVHKGILAVTSAIKAIQNVQEYARAKAILSQAAAHGINTKAVLAEAAGHSANATALTGEAAAAGLAAAGLTAQQVATAGATVAQTGLNTAIWACPITWVIALIIVLIVLIAIFFEQVVGAVYWLGALFKNVGLWIANVSIAIWNSIKNIGLWFANLGLAIWQVIKNIGQYLTNLGLATWAIIKNVGLWFANLGIGIYNVLGACANNVGVAFNNAWCSVQEGFWMMVDAIMQGLKSIADKANSVLGWMGVNIDTSGFDFASKKIDEINSKREDYRDISEAWQDGFNTFAYDDISGKWNTEYGSVGNAFNTNKIDWGKGWSDGMNTFDTFQSGWGSNAYNSGAEVGRNIKSSITGIFDNMLGKQGLGEDDTGGLDPYGSALGDIAKNTGKTAKNTGKSTEELSYLRDIAEREAINRFTTAEIKVDLGGVTNNVAANTDLDGIISYLTDGVAEALVTASEGVY